MIEVIGVFSVIGEEEFGCSFVGIIVYFLLVLLGREDVGVKVERDFRKCFLSDELY